MCVGFEGTSAADAPLARLEKLGVRAAILFARNAGPPESVRRLTADLQRALADDAPALIGVDQEGGAVARLHDGVVALPSMMAVGAAGDVELSRRAGSRLGADLRDLGINLDFAPVLDLALEANNTVIGTRAFGSEPHRVSTLALAFARGLRESGIISVGKHFPGHGATAVDSHVALPQIDVDEATLRGRDLIPFADAVAAKIPALMTAHVVVRALDPDAPATFSKPILTNLLREQLGFEGVLFSDCLEMAAAGDDVAARAPRALAAGVDCLLISHRIEVAEAAITSVARAVESGALSVERLGQAADRMRRLRASIARAAATPYESDADIGLTIARKAVKVLRGTIGVAGREAVTVVSFEEGEPASLSGALRRRGVRSEIMRVALDPAADQLELLEMVLDGLGDRKIVVVVRRAHLHERQASAAARILEGAPHAIVISAREPYDAALFPQARNLACIYNDTAVSIDALADVMTGSASAA